MSIAYFSDLILDDMRYLTLLLLFCSVSLLTAQYEFTHTTELDCTPVKSQAKTGTCWSFATASFLESELMRMGKGEHDLSEMYVVRNIYKDKARNYILRQGKANFSQGSLSHDLMRIAAKNGIVPESSYSGLLTKGVPHNHSEMEAAMKGFLDGVRKSKGLSKRWPLALDAILDVYLGEAPESFQYKGKKYNAQSFADQMEIDVDDYESLTSFTHHPFGESFILEIPDNYSNGSFQNVPLTKLMDVIDKALDQGYTLAWDGDVSEKGFDARKGIAVLPAKPNREDLFTEPGPEIEVTQELRQENFESLATTDDHLMHMVGKAKDKAGNEYYIIKNSWGKISPYKGYLYMSRAYVEMKTVAVMVHKDVLGK